MGKTLFDQTVSTFAPTDDAMVEESYRLGVGDELRIQLFGKDNEEMVPQIGRDGDIKTSPRPLNPSRSYLSKCSSW